MIFSPNAKKCFLLVFFCINCCSLEASAQSPYIKSGSIGSKDEAPQVLKTDLFPDLSVENWVGHRFLFLPETKGSQHAYLAFHRDATKLYVGLPYDDYVGKIAQAVNVDQENGIVQFKIEDTGEIVYAHISNGSINDICLVTDIDNARKRYLGKTLWYNSKQIVTYDETKDTPSFTKTFGEKDIRKYSPVKVLEIVAGWYTFSPVRFIIKSAAGDIGFQDVHMSNTNVPVILQRDFGFSNAFLTNDPRKIYHWSERIWSAIQNDEVVIGMTETAAEMSWGHPSSINTTTTSHGIHEQWVYGDNRYLYFDNHVLTAKQE